MKRARPADEMRRWAIKARLQGMPSREIAQRLDRSHETIKGYLGNCGGTIQGTYHLNVLAAKALFTEQELLELGAVWNGRCWVGPGCNTPVSSVATRCR
jgi:hypothetical protein